MELLIISASLIICTLLGLVTYVQYKRNHTLERENKLQSKVIDSLRQELSVKLVERDKLIMQIKTNK